MLSKEICLNGYIEVVCGPMFAGKTEELIRRANRLSIAKVDFLVFKPRLDDRYSKLPEIVSHNKLAYKCIMIDKSEDILTYIKPNIKAVIIDEAQFLDNEIVNICDALANKGLRVIVGGLDCDFRGVPFGPMPYLLAIAEYVTKLQAVCVKTGLPATKSQRLIDGSPAKYDDELVLIGSTESYEPRSRVAYEHPRKK